MRVDDVLRLPPAVQAAVVLMLWPAIWAGAQLIVALAGDALRQTRTRTEHETVLRPSVRPPA
jgi:hypothetical protein